MFITAFEASYAAPLYSGIGVLYSAKLNGYVTADELRLIQEALNGRGAVTLSPKAEEPEPPVAGTFGETVLASGNTPAAKTPVHTLAPYEGAGTRMPSLEEMSQYGGPLPVSPSAICPCGLTRTDCEYHR